MTHRQRKAALEALLLAYQSLWRPQPFRETEPAWCAEYPDLAREALAMDPASLEARAADAEALVRWLAGHFPDLAGLLPLLELPPRPLQPLPPTDAHLCWGIPGRKLAQIEAFAAALGRPAAPVVEWCAGKGHLGRLLAAAWGIPVLSLEIDPALCAAGTALARRHRLDAAQGFVQADVLELGSTHHLGGRHALALHACGDLHRRLISGAVETACPALDLVPCCYYRTADKTYRPLSGGRLQLSHDDLRLAVTDTVTASPRARQESRTAMAWKLAFQTLARELTGKPYRPLKPVPEAWLADGFAAWCRRLAAREGLQLPARLDWQRLEAEGVRLAGRVRRLELVRLAFRRPLELWLLTDMAVFLEEHGYRVDLGPFCPPMLTPRNLLLSARRP
jgi:hypothetical protein